MIARFIAAVCLIALGFLLCFSANFLVASYVVWDCGA